jgi:hypothetical protein
VAAASLRGQLARSMGKRSGARQCNVVENGEVEVSFIGPKRQWRGEETVAGTVGIKSFGFEVVKEVGEVGWHHFGWGNEGSDSTLQFRSIRVQEGGRGWHATRRCDRMGDSGLGVLMKETVGNLGRYRAKKARVARCASRSKKKKR